MAHIEKRNRGGRLTWRARYRRPDGREQSKSFARHKDAEDWLEEVAPKRTRRWVDPQLGRTLTGEWANRWLAAVEPTLKLKTAASYRSLLRSRILPAFGAVPLAAVKPLDVQRWIGSMESEGLSASRVRQAHVVLSQLLDAAV